MDTSSDSYSGSLPPTRLFGRQRPIHAVLGGGKVGEVLLWRDARVSGGILIGTAAIWFLLEVAEYSLVTLLCHLFITAMLILFIWSSAAQFFKWNTPNIPKIILEDSTSRDVASIFHRNFNHLLSKFLYVASGYDPRLFLLTIIGLWITSIIGSYINSLNLLFFGLVCLETLPFLYEKYEDEVDSLAYTVNRQMKKMYKKFETEVVAKIPKGPVKDKNH
ncbi:reticulon-like protein B9 [Sesamum indicum]|uniref:Reticulon-like protein n=1 Tax=Sesamum indicum TaxID=4182 RepID=A0A6I9U7Y3_SESIN|nr:reticulon-like protein B9 [Sesamum indicum]